MLVKELRDALNKMPGEMSVHLPTGEGIASVKHLFTMNLIGVEQCAEITVFGGAPHTPDMEDSLIKRETKRDRDTSDGLNVIWINPNGTMVFGP